MDSIGLSSAKAQIVNNADDALKSLEKVGLPSIIRPSFTLGEKEVELHTIKRSS